MEDNRLEELCGSVERVVFPQRGQRLTVLELEAGEELHKVVGVLPAVAAGEQLRLKGKNGWSTRASGGSSAPSRRNSICPRVRMRSCAICPPARLRGSASPPPRGSSKNSGTRPCGSWKRNLAVSRRSRGSPPPRQKAIGEAFAGQFGLREVMLAFADYGLTPSEALRCYKRWGSAAVDKIRRNPYLLCSSGLYIGFDRADRICMGMDRPADDPARIEAGLLYVLRHNLGERTHLPARRPPDPPQRPDCWGWTGKRYGTSSPTWH